MKNRGLMIILLAAFMGIVLPSSGQTTGQQQKAESVDPDKVEVYYFHFERRCATCMAVESESEKAIRELYPEKVESGEITFLSVNLEEESNEALAEKMDVSGQTLLVVRGDKQDNLTNTAFMYAKTSPEKLKKAIRESIEKL